MVIWYRTWKALQRKIIASGKTAAGSRWGNAIRLKGKGSYVQCNTNGEYRMLSGVFGPSSQFDSALLARVTVYGDDDQVLYTSPDIHYNEKNVYWCGCIRTEADPRRSFPVKG